jgi:pimeloyl-ACP methyl ester carboxylesterase
VPDPLCASILIDQLAAHLTPRWRVLSISPRADAAYQVQVADLAGVLAQFGLYGARIVAEGLGCATAIVLGAWYPERVAALALIEGRYETAGNGLAARALRECPPDWPRLRLELRCGVVELTADQPDLEARVESLVYGPLP